MNSIPDPPKLCECGCQRPTTIKDGKPHRFIWGHSAAKHPIRAEYLVDCIRIYLTRGMSCLISLEDADLAQMRWLWHPRNYAIRVVSQQRVSLHRVILERKIGRPLRSDEESDHKNGDPTDNRRENLRSATSRQNQQNVKLRIDNTSGHKGVSWYKAYQKWVAYITVDGRRLHLGYFSSAEDASAAYESAAHEHFGEWQRH